MDAPLRASATTIHVPPHAVPRPHDRPPRRDGQRFARELDEHAGDAPSRAEPAPHAAPRSGESGARLDVVV